MVTMLVHKDQIVLVVVLLVDPDLVMEALVLVGKALAV